MTKNSRYKQIIELLSYKPIGHVLLNLIGVSFSVWEYGTCLNRQARRHKIKKKCAICSLESRRTRTQKRLLV